MLLIALLLGHAPPQADPPGSWATFSRSISLRHVQETIDVSNGGTTADGQYRYRLRLTRQKLDQPAEIFWADSGSCPAIAAAIHTMRDIKMPSPAPYGLPGELSITLDGVSYSLRAPSSDNMGELTIRSNVGSSLAAWVERAFAAAAPCWQAKAP